IIQLPFIAGLAWFVTKLIPGEDILVEYNPKHLDPIFIQKSSTVALEQAKAEIVRMGEYAYRGLDETNLYLTKHQQKLREMAVQLECAISNLDRCMTNYLIKMSGGSLLEYERTKYTALMKAVGDRERIRHQFEKIGELIDYKISNKVYITEQA